MGRVSGKVAVVTGAASGLGREIARLLAKEGARVIAADINAADGQRCVEKIAADGDEAFFFEQDVALEEDWRKLMTFILERYGRLDVCVNCAGIFLSGSIREITLAQWRRVMSVNLDGVFLGIKYAAEVMKKNGGGSIVNLSSVGGIVGTVDSAPYNASKGGVRILSKAAAMEFSKAGHDYNIRVNSVHPGVIETPMTSPMIHDSQGGREMLSWTPMGHFGEPIDVAYGVLFLASDESRFMTGSELVVDGGWSAR